MKTEPLIGKANGLIAFSVGHRPTKIRDKTHEAVSLKAIPIR